MGDPKNVRLNDADNPDRAADFERALKRSGTNGNQVLRNLVDAYIAFVNTKGHVPNFPVELAEIERPEKRRKER